MFIPGAKAAHVIVGLGAASTLIQASPVVPGVDLGWVQSVERLGLIGALLLAVYVLWQKLCSKDDILLRMQEGMSRALEANAEANRANAEATRGNTEVTRLLREEIQDLASARAVAERERNKRSGG